MSNGLSMVYPGLISSIFFPFIIPNIMVTFSMNDILHLMQLRGDTPLHQRWGRGGD